MRGQTENYLSAFSFKKVLFRLVKYFNPTNSVFITVNVVLRSCVLSSLQMVRYLPVVSLMVLSG